VRLVAALVVVVACSSAKPPAGVANRPSERAPCDVAATRIDHVTGAHQLDALTARCRADWSADAAHCFARIANVDELVRCAEQLRADARVQLFRMVDESRDERVTVALRVARLAATRTGIAECDAFVAAIARVFPCKAIPFSDRMALFDTTGDFEVFANASPKLRERVVHVCTSSLAALQQQAALAGCAL
jgi:hypothetical protein